MGISIDELCSDNDIGTDKIENWYDAVKYLNKLGEIYYCTVEAEDIPLPVPETVGRDENGDFVVDYTMQGVVIRIYSDILADFFKKRNEMIRLCEKGTISVEDYRHWKDGIKKELEKQDKERPEKIEREKAKLEKLEQDKAELEKSEQDKAKSENQEKLKQLERIKSEIKHELRTN